MTISDVFEYCRSATTNFQKILSWPSCVLLKVSDTKNRLSKYFFFMEIKRMPISDVFEYCRSGTMNFQKILSWLSWVLLKVSDTKNRLSKYYFFMEI
jgi:hypothetical protein